MIFLMCFAQVGRIKKNGELNITFINNELIPKCISPVFTKGKFENRVPTNLK